MQWVCCMPCMASKHKADKSRPALMRMRQPPAMHQAWQLMHPCVSVRCWSAPHVTCTHSSSIAVVMMLVSVNAQASRTPGARLCAALHRRRAWSGAANPHFLWTHAALQRQGAVLRRSFMRTHWPLQENQSESDLSLMDIGRRPSRRCKKLPQFMHSFNGHRPLRSSTAM